MKTVHLHGAIEIENPMNKNAFTMNGHRLKPFVENFVAEIETWDLSDPPPCA